MAALPPPRRRNSARRSARSRLRRALAQSGLAGLRGWGAARVVPRSAALEALLAELDATPERDRFFVPVHAAVALDARRLQRLGGRHAQRPSEVSRLAGELSARLLSPDPPGGGAPAPPESGGGSSTPSLFGGTAAPSEDGGPVGPWAAPRAVRVFPGEDGLLPRRAERRAKQAARLLGEEFVLFAGGLGEEVDVRTHTGFLGGLDPAEHEGRVAYWASHAEEVVFRLPTLPLARAAPEGAEDDAAPAPRRPPPGEHAVAVLWEATGRQHVPMTAAWAAAYPSVPPAQVYILVDPLGGGLFRTRLHTAGSPVYGPPQQRPPGALPSGRLLPGPLVHGAVVSQRLLPALVRETAVNVCRDLLAHERRAAGPEALAAGADGPLGGLRRPFTARLALLARIEAECARDARPAEFYDALFD